MLPQYRYSQRCLRANHVGYAYSTCLSLAHVAHSCVSWRITYRPMLRNLPVAPQMHFEARHPKDLWEPEKCTDLHAMVGGVTTQGVAVRGSTKK